MQIDGNNFSAKFSRDAGTLISLVYNGHETIEQAKDFLGGPVMQVWRAPTDNDKGFGKWLAKDWSNAGLSNLVRHVDSFEATQPKPNEIHIVTSATSSATGGVFKLDTIWTIRGDGSVDMDNHFECSSRLATLPRLGIVLRASESLTNVCWYGRGPWENYSDRKESADMGVWKSSVDEQYVPYVRPQDNGNKEDVRWVKLTDSSGFGLEVSTEESPFSFSALHFTAADLASVRHEYELRPRPEVILSLDAKMCGLGNSSCGPGVLEKYAVKPESYALKLRFKRPN